MLFKHTRSGLEYYGHVIHLDAQWYMDEVHLEVEFGRKQWEFYLPAEGLTGGEFVLVCPD